MISGQVINMNYDRHNPIIKWYQYDATKLHKNVEAEEPAPEQPAAAGREAAGQADTAGAPSTGGTGDPAMDDEVARIMAQFADAKQNSVDDVFAQMAAGAEADEGVSDAASSETSENTLDEDEVARIMAKFAEAKQNSVDDVFAQMAAQEAPPADTGEKDAAASDGQSDQDALLASILKPKQSNVDALVQQAKNT